MSLVFITHPAYPSGILRGEQIAERLNVACNPTEVSKKDTIIMVKTWHPEIANFSSNVYFDLIDYDEPLGVLSRYPNIKIIAMSNTSAEYIKARVENKVVMIPHHHCNYKNITRPEREVKVVGYCGTKWGLNLDQAELKAKLENIGLDFRFIDCERLNVSREEICNFYSELDIQLAYRKPFLSKVTQPELKCPLKLVNAGSFRIPTVAFPEISWRVGFDTFMHVKSMGEMVDSCRILKEDKSTYDHFAKKAYEFSQDYHIDKIVKLYLAMETPA